MSTETTPLHLAPSVDPTLLQSPHHGPHIGETGKRPKLTEIGASPPGDQSHSKAISIHSIPEGVLVEIFDMCRGYHGRYTSLTNRLFLERQLIHVCQRWRYLIFESSRLDMDLVCSPGTPVREGLGWWPHFPIILDYIKVAPKDEANVIAALEHPDRVRCVALSGITRALWEKLDAAMQKPFPALTHLHLTGPQDKGEHAPVLPSNLLGGGTLRLKELYLHGISYPALPKLLLSARDLVELCFVNIPASCYVSPEEMLAGLAGLTGLKSLAIEYRQPIISNLLTDQKLTAPATPTIRLPVLDRFVFKGFSEYMEDLLAQIDAPRVTKLNIDYFSQPSYHVPQLARFLARSEIFKPPGLSSVSIQYIPWTRIVFCGPNMENLIFMIKSSGMVRGILHSVQLCQQLSAYYSSIVSLYLCGPSPASDKPPYGGSLYGGSRFSGALGSMFGETIFGRPLLELPGVQDSIDDIDWIGLLCLFPAVTKLELRGELSENIIHVLELFKGDMVAKVLPALQTLEFVRERPPATLSVHRFVSIRQNAGRPITVRYPDDDDEDDEGENDNDEDEDEGNE